MNDPSQPVHRERLLDLNSRTIVKPPTLLDLPPEQPEAEADPAADVLPKEAQPEPGRSHA